MDSEEFKKDFIEAVKTAAAVTGEGSCSAFVDSFAEYLIEAEVLPDFTPSFYTGRNGRKKWRVDGYAYNEFDNVMNLIAADYDGNDPERLLNSAAAYQDFGQMAVFIDAALKTNLYKEIEMSTPCADLVEFLRQNRNDIRRYRLFLFTDARMSRSLKTVELEPYDDIPIDCQIWDVDRLFRVCCSDQGRQMIEVDFSEYCKDGIPCIEANAASTDQYRSYLGVIPGTVLADIYDKFGSRLLEGNVRSFLSTKVAVNKKIRATILNSPDRFFAYNNGISATAMKVNINSTQEGKFITYAQDLQIINGGQTTASISNARYKDKANLDQVYVQIKLTVIDGSTQEESDELIRNISRSSNSQNKVSDADFFASHPFHRRMEAISRSIYAPAVQGAQYETKWFYERARGQYLQEQMRLTPAKKRQFALQNPKNQVITKTDLAKVQNSWRGYPHVVSKGAQTNFNAFAEYIDEQWNANEAQFNERYYKSTAALVLMLKYLERAIPRQSWYDGGYRANIIYYTLAMLPRLIREQYEGAELDLMVIWNSQSVPPAVEESMISLAELVLLKITDPKRKTANVTQWCKRSECWEEVKKIKIKLPETLRPCLISADDQKTAQRSARKDQKTINEINAQTNVVGYPAEMWRRLNDFALQNHLAAASDLTALKTAMQLPMKIPNANQSKKLMLLLQRAIEEGFSTES